MCECRLNGVFLFFIGALAVQPNFLATFGSLVFTFSPPVNGFSFLLRNLNAHEYSNNSRITVTTASGSIIHSVPIQVNGDINFIGWFQNDNTITSVALSPVTFRYADVYFVMAVALDELRVYTRQQPVPSIAFSLDNCETPNPVYPNCTALSAVFLASTLEAGLVASLQNFDSQIASSTVPNSIFFPTGSVFNGTVDISVVNGTLTSQTCAYLLMLELPARLQQMRTQAQC